MNINTIYTILTIILEIIFIAALGLTAYGKIKERLNKGKNDNKLDLVMDFAEIFIGYAKQYLSTKSGAEKMDFVVGKLYSMAKNYGVTVSEDNLKELAQTVYDELKKLEKKADAEETNE